MLKYKVYIKALLFSLVIAGLFGFANYRNASRIVTDVVIDFNGEENLFITKNEVEKMLIQSLGNVKNKTKQTMFLNVVEKQIQQNSMVEKAEVFLTVDSVLKTNVLQKKQIARILVNGTSYYLDRQGDKMKLSKNYSARVPIVTGVLSDKDLRSVYQFTQKVLSDEFMKKQIIGIEIKQDGRFYLKTRMGNQIVVFGKLENYGTKIKKLKAFYQKMEKDNSLNKYSKINLEYSKQIVCTK